MPWLPSTAAVVAAAIALATLAFGWERAGRPSSAPFAAALGLPLHLLVVATGGLASPLMALIVPWLALVAVVASFAFTASLSGIAALLLIGVDGWARTLTLAGALEAAVVALGGLLPAWLLERERGRAAENEGTLHRILDEVGAGRERGEAAEAMLRLDGLHEALDRIRRALGASRAVLWDVEVDTERARPRVASGGSVPAAVSLAGDPMRWAWEEALPLRLETPPYWADGSARACVVPLEPMGARAALLTLDYDAGQPFPTAEELEEATAQLRAFLRMQQQAARTAATRGRLDLVLELLRRLPREVAVESFARDLATSAMRIAAGSGAAVAIWEREAGRVVAVVGEDGGPAVGMSFGPLESEMALAARHGATLRRERRLGEGSQLPVAAPAERWLAEPRALTVVPLQDSVHGVLGVLAVWSAESAHVDAEVVDVLETLSPYAALQFRQSLAYGNLQEYAVRDTLTGLHNRRAFDERLDKEIARFQRYQHPVSLILLDIDHFKQINDTHGHEAGDAVLRVAGALLQSAVREVDFAARYGGEEFVVLLPETQLADAQDIAERLRQRVEASSVEWNGQEIPVRISLGISAAPECTRDAATLVQGADAALYASKEGGRNRVTTAPKIG